MVGVTVDALLVVVVTLVVVATQGYHVKYENTCNTCIPTSAQTRCYFDYPCMELRSHRRFIVVIAVVVDVLVGVAVTLVVVATRGYHVKRENVNACNTCIPTSALPRGRLVRP